MKLSVTVIKQHLRNFPFLKSLPWRRLHNKVLKYENNIVIERIMQFEAKFHASMAMALLKLSVMKPVGNKCIIDYREADADENHSRHLLSNDANKQRMMSVFFSNTRKGKQII